MRFTGPVHCGSLHSSHCSGVFLCFFHSPSHPLERKTHWDQWTHGHNGSHLKHHSWTIKTQRAKLDIEDVGLVRNLQGLNSPSKLNMFYLFCFDLSALIFECNQPCYCESVGERATITPPMMFQTIPKFLKFKVCFFKNWIFKIWVIQNFRQLWGFSVHGMISNQPHIETQLTAACCTCERALYPTGWSRYHLLEFLFRSCLCVVRGRLRQAQLFGRMRRGAAQTLLLAQSFELRPPPAPSPAPLPWRPSHHTSSSRHWIQRKVRSAGRVRSVGRPLYFKTEKPVLALLRRCSRQRFGVSSRLASPLTR